MDQLTLQTDLPQNSAQKCLKRRKCLVNNSHFKQNRFLGKVFSTTMVTFLLSASLLTGWTIPASSQVAKNYQHWADVTVANWNGDILNAQKSDYFEGQVIPHVHVIQGTNKKPLVTGQSYTFTIVYNFYQSNTNAGGFAFVTTYNKSRFPSLLPGASGLTPVLDNTATPGLNVGGSQGFFYSINADVTAATAPVKSGSGTFDNTVTVTFTYTGTNPQGLAEFYYGLYVAEPGQVPNQGKGITDGASSWSGGSLQTTVTSNFSGALSIQLAPSAIIRGEISGLKYGDSNNNGSRNTGEVPLSGWIFYLDSNTNGIPDSGERRDTTGADGIFFFSVTPDADKNDPDNDPYYVREITQTGWTITQPSSGGYGPILVTPTDPSETGLLFGNFICINPTASETHTNVLCNGGSTGTATISATGGIAPYTFANGSGTYQSSGLFENLAAGTYTFYAKDANGCIDDISVVIGAPAVVVAAQTPTDALCNGASSGKVTISATGGTSPYTFANGAGAYQSSGLFENLAAGTYTFYAKDANGCIDDVSVVIGEAAVLVAAQTPTDALCNGASSGKATISATGGTSPYTFANGSGTYQSSGLFENLAAGTYTFHAKDANGCIDDVTVVIGEPAPLTASASANAVCNNGLLTVSLTITPSGGVGPYQITPVETGVAGSYSYTVTDANGCNCEVVNNLTKETDSTSADLTAKKLAVVSPPAVSSAVPLKTGVIAKGISSELDKLTLTAYPNPFTDQVNFIFKSPASGYAKLEIFDLMGKSMGVVFKGNVEAAMRQTAEFSVPAYTSRTMLLYRLTVGKQAVSGKILPQ